MTSKKLWIFTVGFILLNILFYSFKWGGEDFLRILRGLFPVICSFVAVICLFNTFRSFKTFDTVKLSWFLLLVGILFFFIGETSYAIEDLVLKIDVENLPFTFADYLWMFGYLPLIAGLAIKLAGYIKSGFPLGGKKFYILFVIAFVITVAAICKMLLFPIFKDAEISVLTKVVYAWYPVGDLFLVFPAIILMYLTRLIGKGSLAIPWRTLALGFIFMTISDIIYCYLIWTSKYSTSNFIDVSWNLSYLLIGIAGIYKKEMTVAPDKGVQQ